MSFSDDDLKRLKEIINEHGLITHNMGANVYKALLARLEAAEEVCERAKTHGCEDPECVLDLSLEDWRKAAGK